MYIGRSSWNTTVSVVNMRANDITESFLKRVEIMLSKSKQTDKDCMSSKYVNISRLETNRSRCCSGKHDDSPHTGYNSPESDHDYLETTVSLELATGGGAGAPTIRSTRRSSRRSRSRLGCPTSSLRSGSRNRIPRQSDAVGDG